jgi:hypothetical protein
VTSPAGRSRLTNLPETALVVGESAATVVGLYLAVVVGPPLQSLADGQERIEIMSAVPVIPEGW